MAIYIYIYIRWICQYSVSSLVYQHSILSNIFHFLCCFHKSKTWLIKKVKIKIFPLLQDNDVIKPRQTSERASCPPREQPRHPLQTENRQRISTLTVFLWARVDYASRAAKNSPLGCFCAVFRDSAAAVRIHPHENPNLLQTENRQRISTLTVFLWARVDYASRAAKNSPLGCFCAVFRDSAAAVRIHPHENPNLLQTENRQRISTLTVFLWSEAT